MVQLTMGSMCSGYGGLDTGVAAALGGGHPLWVADTEKGPHQILAMRFPDVPNLGDITTINWGQVPKVDVVTAGFPCQPFSLAGSRLGANDPRHLWPYIASALAELRPRLAVFENVQGLLSAEGEPVDAATARWDARVENLTRAIDLVDRKHAKAKREGKTSHVGYHATDSVRLAGLRRRALAESRRGHRRLIRAIGAVARDLAEIGYDCAWHCIRAADVGAPHGRLRVFIVAYPQGQQGQFRYRNGGSAANPESIRWGLGDPVDHGQAPTEGNPSGDQAYQGPLLATPQARDHKGAPGSGFNDASLPRDIALMPTPRGSDHTGTSFHGEGGLDLRTSVSLLPTPNAQVSNDGEGPQTWLARREKVKEKAANGNGMGMPLTIAVQLLPTPRAADGAHCAVSRTEATDRRVAAGQANLTEHVLSADFGVYAPAILRWAQVMGRQAPAPTAPGANGKPQLSPGFVEWMMGLPDGWVTDVPGLSRSQQLRALGNGVVPHQAAAAVTYLLDLLQEHVWEVAA